jgi:hypothetical protein
MKLIKNIEFYEECKNALVEAFGETELATKILMEKGYSEYSFHDLKENVEKINESFGDKILNFISKSLGGDVSKIDKVMAQMKDEELDFITKEHQTEKEFISLHNSLVRLKSQKAPKDQIESVVFSLKKCEKRMKDLISFHKSIMDDLEKQIDILTKKSNRKAEYYNYKRAKDSVETKKKRAELKYSLTQGLQDDQPIPGLSTIFGTADAAQKDYEKSQATLAKEESTLAKKQSDQPYSKYTSPQLMNMYKHELSKNLKVLKDEIVNAVTAISYYIKNDTMDAKLYKNGANNEKGTFWGADKFYDKKSELLSAISGQVDLLKVNPTENKEDEIQRDQFVRDLTVLGTKVQKLEYPAWKFKDTNKDNTKKEVAIEGDAVKAQIEEIISNLNNINTGN